VSLRWFVRDQSERRQAEEERYRMLVEEVTDYAMFLLDKAGHIVSWNNGAKRLLDYEPDEIIGRHWTRVFTPEDLAAGVPEWEFNTATAEGRAEDERWHVKKDGSRFWASGILTALRGPDDHSDDAEADAGADAADAAPDPAARQQRPGVQPTPRERAEVRFYAKVLRDMTARKELLDRLQASEERLRTVVSNAPVILFALDGLGVFTLAEGRGLAALGLAPQDLVGHSVFEVWAPSGATPAGEATLLDDVRRALEGETFASVREVAGQVLEIWYAPLRSRDSGEQPLLAGVIGVATDVTERVRAEAALRRAHDELEGRVLKRTSELALANAARRELLRKLVAAQEEERRRLSRELHDQMGQHLAALSVNLRTLGDVLVPRRPGPRSATNPAADRRGVEP
jgi:PAS domain S-box-containing protein